MLSAFVVLLSTHSLNPSANDIRPDPLQLLNGKSVRNAEEFNSLRRPEILGLFSEDVFGVTPSAKLPAQWHIDSVEPALGGIAVRKQITISFGTQQQIKLISYCICLRMPKPVGVFVGLNFDGNQTVDADPGISLNQIWISDPNKKRWT
jgi:hypothetical protein